MSNDSTSTPQSEPTIDMLIKRARHRDDPPVVLNRLLDVQREIRARRKAYLGSSVYLGKIVYTKDGRDYNAVSELAEYLTVRTVAFWNKPQEEGSWICRQFYELCLASPRWVEIDDIILLANCASAENTEIFTKVMRELLPKTHMDALVAFVDDCLPLPNSFEDAVLGALSVFLGCLRDPIAKEDNYG